MNRGLSRVCTVDQKASEQVVYSNDQYVCLMKLFPDCMHPGPLELGDYRRFHMRCFLPREALAHVNAKVDRLVIMTNGLDEIHDFSLYDELGCRLASRGLGCILLPLPDHLNRHMLYRIPSPTLRQVILKPSDILMDEAIMLYQRFLQFRDELNVLLRHVLGDGPGCDAEGCKFYRDVFGPRTRISLMGYSLGSAAMLPYFLERIAQRGDVNTCLLLSAAVTLRNTNPSRMFGEGRWEDYVKRFESAFLALRGEYPSGTDLVSGLFGAACFDHNRESLRGPLKENGRKVLFLFGGRDLITGADKMMGLEPKDWGVTKLVLPGINHFLAIDEEFRQWIDLVVNLIVSFERNGASRSITLKHLNSQYESLQTADRSDLRQIEQAESVVRRSKYLGLDLNQIPERDGEKLEAKKITYEDLRGALSTFAPETDDVSFEQKQIDASYLQDKKLGRILYVLGIIRSEELVRALYLQRELIERGVHQRLGEILVSRLKLVRPEVLSSVISAIERGRKFAEDTR